MKKLIILILCMFSTIIAQIDVITSKPSKVEKLIVDTCEQNVDMLFPKNQTCYFGETLLLMKPDSLKGKMVQLIGYDNNGYDDKYAKFKTKFKVMDINTKDTLQYILTQSWSDYTKPFNCFIETAIRLKTINYYTNMLKGNSYYYRGSFNVFISSDNNMFNKNTIDPFTGNAISIKNTDVLVFSKLTIVDSLLVAIFNIGKQSCGLNISELYPNSIFGSGVVFDNLFINKQYIDKLKKKYGNSIVQTALEEKIQIGMNTELVKLAWGLPKEINHSANKYSTYEQWVYYSSYVYFENGKCTGWN